MTRATFDECFDWIEKFHGKQKDLAPIVREQWWDKFGADHDEVFFEAANRATEKLPPGMFPTIERMGQFIAEAREALWTRIKAAEPRTPLTDAKRSLDSADHRNTGHAKSALRAILDVLEGKRDPAEAYGEMAENWPERGWESVLADSKQQRGSER